MNGSTSSAATLISPDANCLDVGSAAPDTSGSGISGASLAAGCDSSNDGVPDPLILWTKVLSTLRADLDKQIFDAYVRPLRLSKFDQRSRQCLVIAPSNFVRTHVERSFGASIEKAFADLSGAPVSVRFLTDPRATLAQEPGGVAPLIVKAPFVVKRGVPGDGASPGAGTPGTKSQEHAAPSRRAGVGAINPRYCFENFVVGSGNLFCHAAAARVAEEPGRNYNPLFIYGGVGLGKTHLLHAIGNAALRKSPRLKVVYLSSEAFTNDLIQALRNAKMDEFKQRMRSIDILLIDDIQFMCGKERTQEEFFHTFNTLYDAKHQIVLTSDRIPQEIPGIEERLQTRFSWGLTADLQAPDFETRVAILKRKASFDAVNLPEDIAAYVAESISSNVRELEGALTRLQAMSTIKQVPLSLSLAKEALRPILQPKQINLSIRDIQRAVSEECGIKISDMTSKRRTKNLSFPRHIAMYLCRKHTTSSYPEIGAEFGNRDHSSVIHAAQVVSAKVAVDPRIRELIQSIEKRINDF